MAGFFLISNKLPEEQKLDRNFAPNWDAMGVLCQGDWTPEREAYLRREIPKQRAGRADYDTLVYARGNRSGRLFDRVVDSLAAGRQPNAAELAQVGYVLRTTAFIGNGQLGTRPLAGFEVDHPMRRPYHAQIWSAFMLREYVFDLIDHLAHMRNPAAVRLDPKFKRYLGLGNSAATGLVSFIANHPVLIHSWSQAYQASSTSARIQCVQADSDVGRSFEQLLAKASQYFRGGNSERDLVFTAPGQVADENRGDELYLVHGCGHEFAIGVPVCFYRACQIQGTENDPAKDRPKIVGVARHHHDADGRLQRAARLDLARPLHLLAQRALDGRCRREIGKRRARRVERRQRRDPQKDHEREGAEDIRSHAPSSLSPG